MIESGLLRLWAGWRQGYVEESGKGFVECVMCQLATAGELKENLIVYRGVSASVALNLYPYGSGHVLVVGKSHVGFPEEIPKAESSEIWELINLSFKALNLVYKPEGINLGANIGQAAGAGIPDHVHFHVLPRWNGDTNFMTTIAETRVLPESLDVTYDKLTRAMAEIMS